MAIDGRDIKRKMETADKQRDAMESRGVGVAAALLVYVPLALLLVGTYLMGTIKIMGLSGGVGGGIVSVLTTAITVAIIWFWRKHHGH